MRKAHLMESIQAWIEKFIEQAQQKKFTIHQRLSNVLP